MLSNMQARLREECDRMNAQVSLSLDDNIFIDYNILSYEELKNTEMKSIRFGVEEVYAEIWE